MHINQYAYLALFSRSITAADMATVIGLDPDEISVRGSRRTEPTPVPVHHCWRIVCRDPGLRVDEQVTRIIDRLTPHTAAIAALAARLDTEDEGSGPVLNIVRYFTDQEPEPETPNLFGWHLDREVLDFLRVTGAAVSVDEYDMTPDPADD